jgi:glycine cleavage system aminomethyltransferase T
VKRVTHPVPKGYFVGRDALVAQKENGVAKKLIGFTMPDRNFPRHGYPVFYNGRPSGVVCSGTMSPTLGSAIGTAYLPAEAAREGTTFEVEILHSFFHRSGRLPTCSSSRDVRGIQLAQRWRGRCVRNEG